MTNEVLTKDELYASIDEAVREYISIMSALNEDEINTIPFENSWTAGQLLRHVTKSTNGMSKAMLAGSKPVQRDSTEKVHSLKKTFLNFQQKFESPEFIVPENETYNKQRSIDELNQSFEKLKENADTANLNDIVEGLPFGPTTKIELLHFVLYHTQRHLHQLRKILEALKK